MISMLGESLPVACGVALTMKMRKRSTVVMASCGDGATNTGSFHEALNFAAVQKLPLVLIIENNGYAYSTPTAKQFAIQDLSERALAYGMPGVSVDGNDVLAVIAAVEQAVGYARSGQGPTLIECKTFVCVAIPKPIKQIMYPLNYALNGYGKILFGALRII